MVFEIKAKKHKKLKVEKSNLTISCIYKIAQSILYVIRAAANILCNI